MDSNREIRQKAFRQLNGRWSVSMLASLIATVLGGANVLVFLLELPAMLLLKNSDLQLRLALGLTVHIAIALFVGGMMELGQNRFYLLARTGVEPTCRDLFSLSPIWFKSLTLRLLLCGEVVLRTLLLIVPGCIALFQYALAPFLMAQNPAMKEPEAIKTSSLLMKGYKARLWRFVWGYFFWFLLSICTCGLGFLWLTPYFKAGMAEFYAQRIAEHDADVRYAQYQAKEKSPIG